MVLERRRYLRHKVHSPAYASIATGVGGVVLDANDRGAAIESVSCLTPQSFVDLRLDLLDTRASAVTPARVAWSDESGRMGLEFLNLTGESRRQLQQWLLLNALLATERAGELKRPKPAVAFDAAPATEPPALQAGDPAFREVAARALACTGAHGAAIAVADGEVIVCRATAGEVAPPPGTKLDTQSGISGACVRSGRWLRCDDPRLDPHVDRESCRVLGINSVMAIPIGERGDILGLIEVFSREAYAFQEDHCSALQELAKTVALWLRPERFNVAPSATAEPVLEQAPSPPLPARSEEPSVTDEEMARTDVAVSTPNANPAVAPSAASATAPVGSASVAAAAPAVAPVAPPAASPPAPAAAPTAGPANSTSPEAGTPAASGIGERVVLAGLVATLVIVGLWFLLYRGAGGTKDVDAAEPSPTEMQNLPQPAAVTKTNPGVTEPSVTADLSGTVRPLRREAEVGDADAEFELGARYASGEDVAQDYGQAVKWFTRAANGGQVLAAATLGAYYWAGRGVEQDDVSAYMWSAIAKEGGDEASKYRLAILRARMTPTEISEAEQRAAAWRRTHARRPLANSTISQ